MSEDFVTGLSACAAAARVSANMQGCTISLHFDTVTSFASFRCELLPHFECNHRQTISVRSHHH